MPQPIIIAGFQPEIASLLVQYFAGREFAPVAAADSAAALAAVAEAGGGLVLLGDLADMDPAAASALIRQRSRLPLIALSQRADRESQIAALDAGADAYLTLPFHADVVLAHARAVLRRAGA